MLSHRPVRAWQVVPKGNYYRQLGGFVEEDHIRIVRAVLGQATLMDWPEDARSFDGLRQAILRGGISSELYNALHAVTAAIFAVYAHIETGAQGRARSEPLVQASPLQFAHNGLRLPRQLVAEVASRAIAHSCTHRLAVIEAERIEAGHACTFALLLGVRASDATALTLTYTDGGLYRWAGVSF